MHTSQYDAWINSLPDDQRVLVQAIMARVGTLLDSRYNVLHEDIQRNTRRVAAQSERIADLNIRLDVYEARQWTAAQEAITQFAAAQLPADQRDALIAVLYRLVAEVETLKATQVNGDVAE